MVTMLDYQKLLEVAIQEAKISLIDILRQYIKQYPEIWHEDIGEV